jgi:hypothetical protein
MMPYYIVIENEQGLAVAEHDPNRSTVEETAVDNGGVVVDREIYKTFEDAYDAMLILRGEEDEDEAM